MSQPRIMTVPKDETLVAFGTMNGIVYAITKTNKCDLYGTYIWGLHSIKKLYWWRPLVVTYTLDDAYVRVSDEHRYESDTAKSAESFVELKLQVSYLDEALYCLDNVTGRLANLNL